MPTRALIIGGGIGGLTAALALSRVGVSCQLFEQAQQFSEIGAGLQLGPNAMRRLHALGLAVPLAQVAAFPSQLHVRRAIDGAVLGALTLGETARRKYGAPYATVHRADLHKILLTAVQAGGADLHTACTLTGFDLTRSGLQVTADFKQQQQTTQHAGDFIVGADGLRSAVRAQLLGDGSPRLAGQVVYRAIIAQKDLPAAQRSQDITVWLGPHLHVVMYPVRGGDALNVAAIVRGHLPHDSLDWNQAMHAQSVFAALRGMCPELHEIIHAMPHWAAWNVYDHPTVVNPQQMAQGRVALLGDAAHPMRPYLAQGAGMATEDAVALADAVKHQSLNRASSAAPSIPKAIQAYATARWQRNARVQARAQRNGDIFHATGSIAWARDASIRVFGARVLDVPWLYGG